MLICNQRANLVTLLFVRGMSAMRCSCAAALAPWSYPRHIQVYMLHCNKDGFRLVTHSFACLTQERFP